MRITRQNTRRSELPLGRPIVPRLTFDIFETLRTQNHLGRRPPTANDGIDSDDIFDCLDRSSSDESDPSDTAGGDTDVEDALDPRFVWENGRRICLVGTPLAQRKAELKPLIEAQEAKLAFRAADTAFPRDRTPKRAWTEPELMRADRYLPQDRTYHHTELLGPNPVFPFAFVDWHGQ
jgi:hypothetical protein